MKKKVFGRLAATALTAAMIGTTVYSGMNGDYNASASEDAIMNTKISVTGETSVKADDKVSVKIHAENKEKKENTFRLYFCDNTGELPDETDNWNLSTTIPCTNIKVDGLDEKSELSASVTSVTGLKKTSKKKVFLKTDSEDGKTTKRYIEVTVPKKSDLDFSLQISSDYSETVSLVSAVSDGNDETYCQYIPVTWTKDENAKSDPDKEYRVYTDESNGWVPMVNGKRETYAKEGDTVYIDMAEQGSNVFKEVYAVAQNEQYLDVQYDEDKDQFYFTMPACTVAVRPISVDAEDAVSTTAVPAYGSTHQLTKYDHSMNSGKLGEGLWVGYFEVDSGTVAFCIDHEMDPPHPGGGSTVGDMTGYNYYLTTTGVYWNNNSWKDKMIRKILWYGYGGPGAIVSGKSGYQATACALSVANGHKDGAGSIGQNFINRLNGYADITDSGFICYSLTRDSNHQDIAFWTYKHFTGAEGQGLQRLKMTYTGQDSILPTLDLYVEKTDVDTGKVLAGASFDVYMDGTKKATITTDENGKASYHWTGSAIYTGYAGSSKWVQSNGSNWNSQFYATQNEVVSAISQRVANLKANYSSHTWKVIETVAPEGYKLNEKVWEQTLTANTTAIEVSFADEPNNGYITLKKASGNTSITKDNSCYDLAGAEYGVYATEVDAKNDTNRKATLTTDKDGNTNIEMVGTGTWYVKEVKAGKGYLLCDGSIDNATGGIHKVEVTAANSENNPCVVECTDPVGNDPFTLQLNKLDYDTGKAEAVGDTSLQGAIFELSYYTNTDGKTTGTPTRKWYFQTNAKGRINCNNESNLINNYTKNDGTVLKSDDLYKSVNTGKVQYPIGTYRIKEVVPPEKYQNVGSMNYAQNPSGRTDVTTGLVAVIKQDSNGQSPKVYDGDKVLTSAITASNLSMNIYDKVYKGSISVAKKDTKDNTTPVAGAKYKLVGNTDGKTYSGTTDANGNVSWSELIPQTYTLTELSTPAGYSLLKDNISVKIPMELTADEIKKYSADINKAVYDEVSQKYCFYDLSYVIGESVTPPFPNTGADQHMLFLLLIGALAITGTGVILFIKRSKKHDEDDLPKGIFSK